MRAIPKMNLLLLIFFFIIDSDNHSNLEYDAWQGVIRTEPIVYSMQPNQYWLTDNVWLYPPIIDIRYSVFDIGW